MNVASVVGPSTDVSLAAGLREHSPAAFAEAYRQHGSAVLGRARARAGDQTVAEDVTQEVFLALWHNPDRFDPTRGSLRAFLLSMTTHRTIDLFRSERARGRRQDGFYPTTESRPDLEDAVVTSDEASRVRDSLATLPSEERLAIDLAYFGHHSYREVAQILGKPEGTIKSRIRIGLQRLRAVPELAMLMPCQHPIIV